MQLGLRQDARDYRSAVFRHRDVNTSYTTLGLGRDDVHVVLPPQPFLHDLQVKQSEEPAAKSEPQRNRAFRLINERGIIQTAACQSQSSDVRNRRC